MGKTTLIMKDRSKGDDVGNYRRIACINLVWKVLTGTPARKIYTFLAENNLISVKQMRCWKRFKGTKGHFIVDKVVTKNYK